MLTPLLLAAAALCAPRAPLVLQEDVPPAAEPSEAERVAELRRRLLAEKDSADTEELFELARIGTRPALEALLEASAGFGSILMRSQSVRALALFDGASCCEQTAFEAIANVATGSPDPEVREAAIAALGRSSGAGKHFLRRIVESDADENVRVAALEAHAALGTEVDQTFYEELWRPKTLSDEEKKAKKREERARETARKRGKEVEEPFELRRPPRLRRVAFGAAAARLSDEAVRAGLADREWTIRGLALVELERRRAPERVETATGMLESLGEHPENRVVAAGVLARARGAEAAPLFLELADRAITPDALRGALADRLAELGDPGVAKKLERALTKGKTREKLFALRATRGSTDPEHGERLVRLLGDRESEVAIAAARQLGERGERRADEALAKLVDGSKDPALRLAAFQARAQLDQGTPAWTEELARRVDDPELSLRNQALRGLGATRDPRWLPVLEKALEDPQWSTRLAALDGLVALRRAEVVPLLVRRMAAEDGRMLSAFADALWRLTGKPFERSAARWKQWWEREGAGFEPIDEAELARLGAEREARRMRETTRVASRFFGLRIESRRVLFVIDVSGSMGQAVGAPLDPDKPESRLAAAKRELVAALESLDPGTWFDVLAFAGGVQAWSGKGEPASPESVRDACTWVRRLGLQMTGTALWDALQKAFANPEVDTILLLSDGQPEGGAKDDPEAIRADVASWNRDRKVLVHTVALGEELRILRWLSEDSGGSHVFVP